MKLKFILLLLTFSATVFLFSQNKTSNNKKAESVENTKREKENSFNSKIAEAKAKLGSTEEHGFSTKRSSDGMARPNYEEMGYGEVAEAAEN